MGLRYNKQFKRDSQRLAPSLQVSLVSMAQCFRFGWRRCSPLNWALCDRYEIRTQESRTKQY
ncbi:hypothetical protein BTO19_24640 [Vibrio parahaemolyticus]|nr:hypothetical protein BTO19_24640 [Vibrio parahaemolyticus]TBT60329.1 hypothetical protein D5E77_25525 [Vibrio parahaemolyticus]TOC01871.1 hypothetical protein CGJ92_24910 [Vibrio parahaemolyticus]TOQ36381.1 hypothetical protein CGG96_24875 [Vibrio parahaemolyticus]TOQ56178.1 hypothetical protein CGG92_25140 [Vibrio parahaemolyticus]